MEEKYKTIKQIEEELNESFIDVYNRDISSGLSISDMAIKYQIKHPAAITQYLYNNRIKDIKPLFDIPIFVGLSMPETEKRFEELYGLNLMEFLKQKYIEEKLSMGVIAKLLECSEKTVKNTFDYYGIKIKKRNQARADAIDTGNLNYGSILNKVRKTKRKTTFSGSFSEQRIRMLIQYYLYELFNQDYEIVIGFNEYSILRIYEVDIPIIVINTNTNKTYKFAVEVNGPSHCEKDQIIRDETKIQQLKKKNWIHKSIVLTQNIEILELEGKSKDISQEIHGYVISSDYEC